MRAGAGVISQGTELPPPPALGPLCAGRGCYLATSVAAGLFQFSQRIPTDTRTDWSRDTVKHPGVARGVRKHRKANSLRL